MVADRNSNVEANAKDSCLMAVLYPMPKVIKSWRNNWDKLLALSPSQRWVLCMACLSMPLISLSLRLVGLRKTRALLATHSDKAIRRMEAGASCCIRSTARLVRIAARLTPGKPACLTQSVTLCYLLARKGISSQLKIGVQKEPGIFKAHAWVEAEGLVLLDQADVEDRFRAIV
jgi:hypothetical protein